PIYQLKDPFRRLMELIPTEGKVYVCRDYPAAMEVAARACSLGMTYGDAGSSDWTARIVRFSAGKGFFDAFYRGNSDATVEVGLIGRHNVNNALAAYALAKELGIDRKRMLEGFATFSGIK